jgi:predicted DNA-binding ArsR family transcriptional regulator
MLRAVDTKVKREVLKEVTLEWRTTKEVEAKFGPEGPMPSSFLRR